MRLLKDRSLSLLNLLFVASTTHLVHQAHAAENAQILRGEYITVQTTEGGVQVSLLEGDAKTGCKVNSSFDTFLRVPERGEDKFDVVHYRDGGAGAKTMAWIETAESQKTLVVSRDFDVIRAVETYQITGDGREVLVKSWVQRRCKESVEALLSISPMTTMENFTVFDSQGAIKAFPVKMLGEFLGPKDFNLNNHRGVAVQGKQGGYVIAKDFGLSNYLWHTQRACEGGAVKLRASMTGNVAVAARELRIRFDQELTGSKLLAWANKKDSIDSLGTFIAEQKSISVKFLGAEVAKDSKGWIAENAWPTLRGGFNRFIGTGKSTGYPMAVVADEKTKISAVYDADNLYLRVEALIPEGKLTAAQEDGSLTIYQDDSIEIFIRPLAANEGHKQFIYNSKGSRQVSEGDYKQFTVQNQVSDGVWKSQVTIPLAVIGGQPKPTDSVLFNVTRTCSGRHSLSSWSFLGEAALGFHTSNNFGRLVFDPVITMDDSVLSEGLERRGIYSMSTISAHFKEPRSDLRFEFDVTLDGPGSSKVQVPVTFETSPRVTLLSEKAFKSEQSFMAFARVTDSLGIAQDQFRFSREMYSGIASRVWPISNGTTRYYCQGVAGVLPMIFGNYSGKPQKFRLIIETPVEMELVAFADRKKAPYASHYPLKESKVEKVERDGLPYHRYSLEFTEALENRALPAIEESVLYMGNSFQTFLRPTTLSKFNIYFRTESQDRSIVEDEQVLQVNVLPKPAGKQPKKFEAGLMSWWFDQFPPSIQTAEERTSVAKDLLELWRVAGCNYGVMRAETKQISELSASMGITLRPNFWWFWTDPEYLKEHPEDGMITFEGKRLTDRVSPCIMLNNESAFARSKKRIEEAVTIYGHGLFHDTEGPSPWQVCFHPESIKAFEKRIDWKGEPLTPVKIRSTLSKEWVDFCAWQWVATLTKMKEVIRKVNPEAKLATYSGLDDSTLASARFKYELVPETACVDIIGPSWYFNSLGPVQFWDKNAADIESKVPGYPVNVWLNNDSGTTDHRSFRLQAMKAAAIGFEGYTYYYDMPFLADGRKQHDLATVNTIVADFEAFLAGGTQTVLPKSGSLDKSTLSVNRWDLADETVWFVFNIDPMNPADVGVPINDQMVGKEFTEYITGAAITPGNGTATVSVPAGGFRVIYAGSKEASATRKSTWNNTKIFYLE